MNNDLFSVIEYLNDFKGNKYRQLRNEQLLNNERQLNLLEGKTIKMDHKPSLKKAELKVVN